MSHAAARPCGSACARSGRLCPTSRSTGKPPEDTHVLLGSTEYNCLGTAHQVGTSAAYQQRGFELTLTFNQHYQRRGWSLVAGPSISNAA